VDPSDCLMETLVLRENQEGIRIRRSPGNYAKHLPRVLECVFLQTLCGLHDDGQAQPDSVTSNSNMRENGDQCVSSDVLGSGSQCVSSDV
jgi:hypothetical protein